MAVKPRSDLRGRWRRMSGRRHMLHPQVGHCEQRLIETSLYN